MSVNLVDTIGEIISKTNLTVVVKEIVGSKIFVCKTTLHITIGNTVKDTANNEYTVSDMVVNEWLELTPLGSSPVFNDSVIIGPPITYLHGTPSSTNIEYVKVDPMTVNKVPFAWLLEVYQYDQPGPGSSLAASFSVVIFFLTWGKEVEWTNQQQNERAIKPMENLANSFLEAIEADYTYKTLQDVTIRPRSRFGVEVTNKGSERKILDEDLSGVEMRFTLELYKVENCC